MVTLIFTWDSTTNSTVTPSAQPWDENTSLKPARYICVGSMARSTGTSRCKARKARKAPASILSMPGTTHPGPATSTAVHQRTRLALVFSGRKRRKSTCSPTCRMSENATVAAMPKADHEKLLSPDMRPASEVNST